ncbi:MAG: tetratricopeptide repeat protein [Planctomycetota bacterium]
MANGDQGRRWSVVYIPLLIILAGACVYSNSLSAGFVFDDAQIVADQHIRRLWPPWDVLASSRRPVVNITLAMNYAADGLNPRGYHAVNAVIHILAALFLYGIVRRTLVSAPLGERYGVVSARLALVVALIWVVHPLQTQSVTYTIQRAESLMGLWYLATLYCLIRGAGSRRRVLWFLGAVFACGLGMGSKAVMVTTPVAVLAYDRAILSESWSEVLRRRWGLYVGLAATWAVQVRWGVTSGVLNPAPRNVHVGFGYHGITPLEYALTQPGVIVHYLRLSLWPHPLCLDYEWPVARGAAEIIPPALLIFALIGATLLALRKAPGLALLGIWFFLILAPTSSFIPVKDVIFEHRMYLPLVSVVTLVVLAAYHGWVYLRGTLHARVPEAARSGVLSGILVPASVVLGVVATLGYSTYQRNAAYASDLTMWQDVVENQPGNSRARNNLATRLISSGLHEQAVEHLWQALRIDPRDGEVWANLGSALRELERYDDARLAFERAAAHSPGDCRVYVNLGDCLHRVGRMGEARDTYLRALRLNTRNPRVHYGLGRVYRAMGRLDASIAAFKFAVQFKPDFADAYFGLAEAMMAAGRTDEAIDAYRKTLSVDPNYTGAPQALEEAMSRGE